MVQFYQPAGLSDPGPTAAASLLGTGIGSLTDLINARKNRKNTLIQQGISTAGTLGSQVLQGEQAKDLQEQKQPFALLGAVDDIAKAAEAAELAGDLNRATQLRQVSNQIVDKLFGTSGALGGTPGLQPGAQPPMGATIPSPGITPSPTATTGGDQLIPPTEPQAPSDTVASMDTGSPNVTGKASGYSIPIQQKILKNVEESQKAAKAQLQLGTLDAFDNVVNAPVGAELQGLGGGTFKDVSVTPELKTFAKLAQRRAAMNPEKFDDLTESNRKQAGTVFDILRAAEEMRPAFDSTLTNPLARSFAAKGVLPSVPGLEGINALTETGLISGSKNPEAFAGAIAADKSVGATLGPLMKTAFSESGNLSDGDINRAAGFVPRMTDDKRVFERKIQQFAKILLPKIMDAAVISGDTVIFNQAQEAYETLFKNPYKINTKEAIKGEFFKGDTAGTTVNFKQGKATEDESDNNAEARRLLGL